MTHLDRDRLTAWVHGFADAEVDAHLSSCPECRDSASALKEEARLLSREIADPQRLAALKAWLLQAAGGRRRSLRGLLWQIPVAAAALIGLVGVLLFPGSRHRVLDGRVALEDGRVVEAPVELAAQQRWQLQAVGKASVRLSDRSTVDLSPGARIALAPNGARGVQADLASGEAAFAVAPAATRLTVCSPAGRVEASDGKFSMRIVLEEEGGTTMNKTLAGAIVTVFAGSISLSNANGAVEAAPGQSAVLAKAEAPLFLAAPQDKQEELLRRLEQLAAKVAKLEEEVSRLEKQNTTLKAQLGGGPGGAPGSAVWSNGGGTWTVNPQGGGVRVVTSGAGGGVGGTVIIEEKVEKKVEPNKER